MSMTPVIWVVLVLRNYEQFPSSVEQNMTHIVREFWVESIACTRFALKIDGKHPGEERVTI